jgi:putative transposase
VRRNKLEICLHFVWGTWDRLPLVTLDRERDLYRYIETVCKGDKCEVLAIGGMPDHVHLLILFQNTLSVADLMNHVKGGSSRFVSEKLAPGQWFAWQSNYGAFSISRRDRNMVIRYINNQKQHHREGTLWPDAEHTCDTF